MFGVSSLCVAAVLCGTQPPVPYEEAVRIYKTAVADAVAAARAGSDAAVKDAAAYPDLGDVLRSRCAAPDPLPDAPTCLGPKSAVPHLGRIGVSPHVALGALRNVTKQMTGGGCEVMGRRRVRELLSGVTVAMFSDSTGQEDYHMLTWLLHPPELNDSYVADYMRAGTSLPTGFDIAAGMTVEKRGPRMFGKTCHFLTSTATPDIEQRFCDNHRRATTFRRVDNSTVTVVATRFSGHINPDNSFMGIEALLDKGVQQELADIARGAAERGHRLVVALNSGAHDSRRTFPPEKDEPTAWPPAFRYFAERAERVAAILARYQKAGALIIWRGSNAGHDRPYRGMTVSSPWSQWAVMRAFDAMMHDSFQRHVAPLGGVFVDVTEVAEPYFSRGGWNPQQQWFDKAARGGRPTMGFPDALHVGAVQYNSLRKYNFTESLEISSLITQAQLNAIAARCPGPDFARAPAVTPAFDAAAAATPAVDVPEAVPAAPATAGAASNSADCGAEAAPQPAATYHAQCSVRVSQQCSRGRGSLRSDTLLVYSADPFNVASSGRGTTLDAIVGGFAMAMALSCLWRVELYLSERVMAGVRRHLDGALLHHSGFPISGRSAEARHATGCFRLPPSNLAGELPSVAAGCAQLHTENWLVPGDWFQWATRRMTVAQRALLADLWVCAAAALVPSPPQRAHVAQELKRLSAGVPFAVHVQRGYCGGMCLRRVHAPGKPLTVVADGMGDHSLCVRVLAELGSPLRALPDGDMWREVRAGLCGCKLSPSVILSVARTLPGARCAAKVLLVGDRICGASCHGCESADSPGSFASWQRSDLVMTLSGPGPGADGDRVVDQELAEGWAAILARARVSVLSAQGTAVISAWAAVHASGVATAHFPTDLLAAAPLRWSARYHTAAFSSQALAADTDSEAPAVALADPAGSSCSSRQLTLPDNGTVDVRLCL